MLNREIACLALQVKSVSSDLGYIPVSAFGHLVSRNKVPHKEEDVHHDVLRDRDHVRSGDLEHLNAVLNGGVEVDVIRADTGSDTDLEVLCFVEEVGSEIAGVEGSSNEDLGLHPSQ